MSPPSSDSRYDPVPPIPTYEEAIASGHANYRPTLSPTAQSSRAAESESLLRSHHHGASSSSSYPPGYRPPTVETDDEDEDDDNELETAEVRREMQEMEIDDSATQRLSSWRKRIPFLLPRWKWTWRFRMPQLPNLRSMTTSSSTTSSSTETESRPPGSTLPTTTAPTPSIAQYLFQSVSDVFSNNGEVVIQFVARGIAMLIFGFFFYIIITSDFFALSGGFTNEMRPNPEDLRIFLQSNVNTQLMQDTLQHFTNFAHVAGTEGDYALAIDTRNILSSYGLEDVMMDEYEVYLTYPSSTSERAVEVIDDKGTVTWKATLQEKVTDTKSAGHYTTFSHAHAASGTVRGPLIYINYGLPDDHKKIAKSKITTKGSIALIRQYGAVDDASYKVHLAEEAGFAGCIFYSDPADDGFVLGEVAPKGRFMPPDGIQRTSVSQWRRIMGDVLTPGWASKGKKVPRVEKDKSHGLVHIPSIPISWSDATFLLQQLHKKGQQVPKEWVGGIPDVKEWWTGAGSEGKSPFIVNLRNEQDEIEKQKVWNVYGKIPGVEQNLKSVIIGTRRDALSVGASGHTGMAVLLEIARLFSVLQSKGWKPLRSIEFMTWDATQYNMIGATEFIESAENHVRDNSYAYINLDTAISGPELHATGSPMFWRLFTSTLNRVFDPAHNDTLLDSWNVRDGEIEEVQCASNMVPFQSLVGVSSFELSFRGHRYPRGSAYDDADWVKTVVDGNFDYHLALTQVASLMVLDLADRWIVPLDSEALSSYLERALKKLDKKFHALKLTKANTAWDELKKTIESLQSKAHEFHRWEEVWQTTVLASGNWESNALGNQRLAYNDLLGRLESEFLDLSPGGGLPDREQYKNFLIAPPLEPTSAICSDSDAPAVDGSTYFAAIQQAMLKKDDDLLANATRRTAELLQSAVDRLALPF